MNFDKFVLKHQELITKAQAKALEYGHQDADVEHLLLALADQKNGLLSHLLSRLGIKEEVFRTRIVQELGKIPRMFKYGIENTRISISERLDKILFKSRIGTTHLKDDLLSAETLVLAFLEEGPKTPIAKIFKEFRISRDRLYS